MSCIKGSRPTNYNGRLCKQPGKKISFWGGEGTIMNTTKRHSLVSFENGFIWVKNEEINDLY